MVETVVTTIEDEFNFYVNDWYELSKYSQFVFSVYLNPIMTLCGILINIAILQNYFF